MYLLMQTWVLQSRELASDPEQVAPPYWGEGLVQDLDLDWVPPPHVTEHIPYEPQPDQDPSTVKLNQTPKLKLA
jgi:hypothetical protein